MAKAYRQAQLNAFLGKWNWTADTIKVTLHTATYSPNFDTHAFVSDLTNEVASGAGYTTAGVTLTSPTAVYTAANSWGTSAATSTAYAVETVVRPSTGNGFLYRCAVAGTSGGTAPTWGTVVGGSTTDGGVTWENVGSGAIALSGASVSWASASFTARYAVISDRTPGTAATQPLIGLFDFGTTTAGGGTFQINWNAQGILLFFTQ